MTLRDAAWSCAPRSSRTPASGRVLMLAWMDDEARRLTRETGEAWFWSRSRQELWHKGATSGNTLAVEEIRDDCDGDALLLRVRPAGPACHTGSRLVLRPVALADDRRARARAARGLVRRVAARRGRRRVRAQGRRGGRRGGASPRSPSRTSGSSKSSPTSGSTATSCSPRAGSTRARSRTSSGAPPALSSRPSVRRGA